MLAMSTFSSRRECNEWVYALVDDGALVAKIRHGSRFLSRTYSTGELRARLIMLQARATEIRDDNLIATAIGRIWLPGRGRAKAGWLCYGTSARDRSLLMPTCVFASLKKQCQECLEWSICIATSGTDRVIQTAEVIV